MIRRETLSALQLRPQSLQFLFRPVSAALLVIGAASLFIGAAFLVHESLLQLVGPTFLSVCPAPGPNIQYGRSGCSGTS